MVGCEVEFLGRKPSSSDRCIRRSRILTSAVELIDDLDQVGQRPFQNRRDRLETAFSSGASAGSWKALSPAWPPISWHGRADVRCRPSRLDHHDRAAQLLVRGVQEAGIIPSGEPLLLLLCPPGTSGTSGRQPGLTAIGAASDTRVSCPRSPSPPGVWPRRPGASWAASGPSDSYSKQSQAPRSAAVLL